MVYLIAATALPLGWLAGLLTFRRTLKWCPDCGAGLKCPSCVRLSFRHMRQPVHGHDRSG